MPLSDIMQLRAGRVIQAAAISRTPDSEHPFPCYGGNGLRGYAGEFSHEGPTILIGRQGALSGNVRRVDGQFYATEHALVASLSDRLDRDWASHMLSAMDLNQYASRGALPGLAVATLNALRMPVPSVERQRKTAAVLDAFGSLTDNLVVSLSAELAARSDLYEHYRDRLLTFKELAA